MMITAENGHNLLLSGQAGTGKSFLVNGLVRKSRSCGRKVVVVSSSGISCSVFGDGIKSSTVHSHYGLQTADMPTEMVVARAASMPHCVSRIKAADTIIWDEAGMSSRRIFELVNSIHHKVAEDEEANKPFASKQVIIVGEFLQLRPVPGTFDDGEFMFYSKLFEKVITHRFELKTMMRQNLADQTFIHALKELRLGICSAETEAFIESLNRDIEGEAVDIYFTKLSVQLHNQEALFKMQGELITFDAIDEGYVTGISCPADLKLLIKPNAKVMIVWNVSEKVKNGTAGKFIGIKDDKLEVEVEKVGRVFLQRETWSKRNRSGQIVGSRTQFPVILFYACTCHKTQGLTLPLAVVHCSKEFVPGLIYVAVSRVRCANDLAIRRFKPAQLLTPPAEVFTVCENSSEEHADLTCCVNQHLKKEMFKVCDVGEEFGEEDADAPEVLPVDSYPDGLVSSYFEKDEDVVITDLGTVYLALEESEHELSQPPEHFDIVKMLREQSVPIEDNQFCSDKNAAISKVLSEYVPQLQLFSLILWFKIFQLMGDHLVNNAEEIVLLRKHLTDATHHLYLDIIGSVEHRQELRALFHVEELSEAHVSIGSTLCLDTFVFFVHHVAHKFAQRQLIEQVDFNVSEMPVEGLAKLRHVGGWAIRKEHERCRRHIRQNMFSQSTETRQRVLMAHAKCELLEEHVIVQYSWLKDNSNCPATLEVTEVRQYRNRGLINISDEAFACFKRIEEIRVEQINVSRIMSSENKGDIADLAIQTIQADETLLTAWKEIFKDIETSKEVSVYLYMCYCRQLITCGAAS